MPQQEKINNQIPAKVIPKYPGKGKEGILIALREGEGLTSHEITKMTGLAEDTVKNYLYQLNKEKKIDKSTTIPRIYYIKGENTDLKRMIPPGTKVSVLKWGDLIWIKK